jgi:hypothetical protein
MRLASRFGGMLVAAGAVFVCGVPRSVVLAQDEVPAAEEGAEDKQPVGKGEKSMPRISLHSLQVTRPIPAPAGMAPGMIRQQRFGMQRFGMQQAPTAGTTLTFLVEEPQQEILGLEMKDCKITKFCDDKNTDLTQGQGSPEPGNPQRIPGGEPETFSFSGELDPDGHRATITVHSPLLPANGASRLLLEAELVMKYGRGEKVVELKNVDLKADKIAAGPVRMLVMIQDRGRGGMGQPNGTQVAFHHTGPVPELRKLAFFGADGEEIKSMPSGSGWNGSNYQEYFSLDKRVESCTIKLTVPEKIETVTTAVSINTGIGFPPFVRRKVVPASGDRQAGGSAPR